MFFYHNTKFAKNLLNFEKYKLLLGSFYSMIKRSRETAFLFYKKLRFYRIMLCKDRRSQSGKFCLCKLLARQRSVSQARHFVLGNIELQIKYLFE